MSSNRVFSRISLPVAFSLLLIVVAGCGSKYQSSVSGRVTQDNKPITTGGAVVFHPVGQGPVAYGQIQPDGRYEISTGDSSGLTPGDYRVTVVSTGPPPADDVPGPLLTPPKYGTPETTDLHVTVKPGSNDIPLDLKSE